MRSVYTLLALVSALSTPSWAELDFTPQHMVIGGGLAERTYFKDGTKRLAVTTDQDTKVTGEAGGAVFRFGSLPGSFLQLGKSPHSPKLAFDPESLKTYMKTANALLPAAAEGRVLVAQATNVFPVNQWKSVRFVFTYSVSGTSFMESVTFLNLDETQQVVLLTSAPEKDFETATFRADDIMRRWHEVLPGDELGAN